MEQLTNTQDKKRIVITGGTEGIGRSIAEELFEDDHEVAICARTQEKIDEMKNSHEGIIAERVDLKERHKAQEFIDESILKMGGLDVIILNAGVTGLEKSDLPETKKEVFDINTVANVAMSKTALKYLQSSRGTLVFITSGTAHTDITGGIEAYRESKLRMEQWLKQFSEREGNEGIKIFSINPGSVDTRMHQEVLAYGKGEIRERTEKMVEEKKLRDPEIVGRIISKMALSGCMFDPENKKYDIPIRSGEVVAISDENIEYENAVLEASKKN